MATLGHPPLTSHHSARKLERRPPMHDNSRDSTNRLNAINLQERLSDMDVLNSSQHRRNVLDYLANDGGDNYLDNVYTEDDRGSTNSGFERESFRSRRHQSIPLDPSPSSSISGTVRNAGMNPNDVEAMQLRYMVAERADRKQRARVEKELAWQKVRQHLIEEENKSTTRNDSSYDSTNKAIDSLSGASLDENRCDTVKLLDSLARSGSEAFSYNRSISSDGDMAPIVDSSLVRSQISSSGVTSRSVSTSETKDHAKDISHKLTSHMDRMGNKLVQFLNRGQNAEDVTDSVNLHIKSASKASTEPFVSGKSSPRLTLLARLDQVARSCQKTDFSESSMAQISSHLVAIEHIVREEMDEKNGKLRSGSRRLSNSQWTKSDHEMSDNEKDHRSVTPIPESSFEYPSIHSVPPDIGNNTHAKVSSSVLNSYKAFDAAQDLEDTVSAFNYLLTDCGLNGIMVDEPWHVFSHIKAAVYSKLSFRHKQLFKLLDARLNNDVYKRRSALGKSVCIVGAGPVGLRAAIETALLGGQVVVLEKRKDFSRENMLRLWPWVVQDLTSLGAKVLFSNFCKSFTYFHVSTRQLQVLLLKVALLLGVKVFSSTEFESIEPPGLEENGGNPFYTLKTQPQIPMMEFTAVLGASGTNDKLAIPAGINRFVFCKDEALGIMCYFPNIGTSEEMKVKEFSWTTQLKHQMLHKLRDIGIDLENVLYYRGEMHYLVMTPKRQNLLDWKVLNENHANPADLVMESNVNQNALQEFVKAIVDFAGIPKKTDFSRVNLFDFSTRTRADKAASVLTSHGKKLYVGLIGDSLLEPLWHEDIGTCRGFLSALDGVWMIAQIGSKADEQLLADREVMYRVVQRLTGRHRDEMQKSVRKYTVDPRSRYVVHFPRVI